MRVSGRIQALRRFRALSRRDVADLLRAQWHLLRARLSLVFTPRGRLLRPAASGAVTGVSARDDSVRVAALALAVDRAADYGVFRPTCLVRSIALERLLRRERLDAAVVRIGVRDRGGRMEAHAWIEIDGVVVGDRPEHTATFTPLDDFTVVART